jgi:hypothetical protein
MYSFAGFFEKYLTFVYDQTQGSGAVFSLLYPELYYHRTFSGSVRHKLYYFHFCQNFPKKKKKTLTFENSIKVTRFKSTTNSTK